jgi:hypothetical protein
MASEQKTGVDQSARQIRASVLHGAKDLRIVRCSIFLDERIHADFDQRKTAQSSHPPQQSSRLAYVALVFAVPISTTTDIIAMATSLCESPCHLGMNQLV